MTRPPPAGNHSGDPADQLSDPRNVGAIMRSARAFGVTAIIATHRNTPEESGALARTATGALEHVPMVRVVNLSRAIQKLQAASITVAGLTSDGAMRVQSLSQFPRLAGWELRAGLRPDAEHCDVGANRDVNDAAWNVQCCCHRLMQQDRGVRFISFMSNDLTPLEN